MSNIVWHQHAVDKQSRAEQKGQKPLVIWFTGLSGAGKSTVFNLLTRMVDPDSGSITLGGVALKDFDLGVLREEGVSPERIIGYCAWMLGLLPQPVPCRPSDLLDGFTWNIITDHRNDHRCDTQDLLR